MLCDAQIQILHLGKLIITFDTPSRQFYSAIAYKYRDGKNGDALKITFTSEFVAFLKDSLADMGEILSGTLQGDSSSARVN